MIKEIIGKHISLETSYWQQELYGNWCVIFNGSDIAGRIKKIKFRRSLMRSQWLPVWRLEQYQLLRLKCLVRHIYRDVPYYRDIFRKNRLEPGDFKSIQDLKKLPVLTRQDLVNNLDSLLSRKAQKKHLILKSTSGSTGTPVSFYHDEREEYRNYAFFDRAFASVGARMHWRSVWIRQRPFSERNSAARYIYEPHFKQLTLPAHRGGKNYWEEKIDLIKQYKPEYLVANPYLLCDLAFYAKENKISVLRFKFIMSAFENLYPYQRKIIEEEFQCKVYSRYECQERAVSAFECERQEGFHLDMEKSIVEIIDRDGKEVPLGRPGRLITTSLHNFAMPLIRYDIGDIASLSDVPCSCGRSLQLLRSLNGRSSNVIRYKDKRLCENDLSFVVMRCKNIKAVQFIQEEEEGLLVNIVKKDNFSEDDARDLIRNLHEIIDERLHIKLDFLDFIPCTSMGKFPLIISKMV
jgi:phenylacetate-CoA ligase